MFNKLGKSKLFKFTIGCAFLIALSLFVYFVIAAAPGVTLNLDTTESTTGLITFSVNTTYDYFEYPKNVTLYLNYSSTSADKNQGIYTANETNDLSNLENGTSSNTSDFIQLPLELGYYWHWSVFGCADNCSDYPTCSDNLTQCAYSSTNGTIYVNPVTQPSAAAPTIDLISPADGSVSGDGALTFTVNITSNDNYDLLDANVSIHWNWTTNVGEKGSAEEAFNFTNILLIDNETQNAGANSDTYQFTFNSTYLTGGNIANNKTVFWTAYGCLKLNF